MLPLLTLIHRYSALDGLLFLSATAQFPSLQKLLGLVEREALCAYRRHNINGTEQCKTISNLLDCKFQPTG
jgi:hypothetical protein